MLTPEQRKAADLAAFKNRRGNEKPENVYKVRVQVVYPDASAVQHPVSGAWYVRRWTGLEKTPRLYRGPGARTEAEAWRDAWDKLNER